MSEDNVQVKIAKSGRIPVFACPKRCYARSGLRRQNLWHRRSRFTFAYCLICFVVIALVYHILKYSLIDATNRPTAGPEKAYYRNRPIQRNECPSYAKQTYDEIPDLRSHTSFSHDGYCYYILQVQDAKTIRNCIVDGFVLSHFIQRGKKIRKYLFDKVNQLGHDDKPIHIGAFIECFYCGADTAIYKCNGCIVDDISNVPTNILDNKYNSTHKYICPDWSQPSWHVSSHGLQFLPPCADPYKYVDPSYGIFLESGEFKYIEEFVSSSLEGWYLCEMKLYA